MLSDHFRFSTPHGIRTTPEPARANSSVKWYSIATRDSCPDLSDLLCRAVCHFTVPADGHISPNAPDLIRPLQLSGEEDPLVLAWGTGWEALRVLSAFLMECRGQQLRQAYQVYLTLLPGYAYWLTCWSRLGSSNCDVCTLGGSGN